MSTRSGTASRTRPPLRFTGSTVSRCLRLAASGLCHSDEHVRIGDIPLVEPGGFPFLGGHEGAGTVTKVGAAAGQQIALGATLFVVDPA